MYRIAYEVFDFKIKIFKRIYITYILNKVLILNLSICMKKDCKMIAYF